MENERLLSPLDLDSKERGRYHNIDEEHLREGHGDVGDESTGEMGDAVEECVLQQYRDTEDYGKGVQQPVHERKEGGNEYADDEQESQPNSHGSRDGNDDAGEETIDRNLMEGVGDERKHEELGGEGEHEKS